MISNDYHYITKKKSKNSIIIEGQHLKGIPTKRKNGFDISKLIINYEKYFLNVTHNSLYPKNIQNVLEEFEDLKEFHKNLIISIKNMTDTFLERGKFTTKEIKSIIKKI